MLPHTLNRNVMTFTIFLVLEALYGLGAHRIRSLGVHG